MTLEEWSWVASIVSSTVNVVLVGISTTVAVYLYQWHRETAKLETTRQLHEDLRHHNELVLNNEDLQELAVENHPWGAIQKKDVVRMYRHFIHMNIAFSMWEAKLRETVSDSTYESMMNNTANVTFKDREFIKQHVLPRGYPIAFRQELITRWTRVDNSGPLPSV